LTLAYKELAERLEKELTGGHVYEDPQLIAAIQDRVQMLEAPPNNYHVQVVTIKDLRLIGDVFEGVNFTIKADRRISPKTFHIKFDATHIFDIVGDL